MGQDFYGTDSKAQMNYRDKENALLAANAVQANGTLGTQQMPLNPTMEQLYGVLLNIRDQVYLLNHRLLGEDVSPNAKGGVEPVAESVAIRARFCLQISVNVSDDLSALINRIC